MDQDFINSLGGDCGVLARTMWGEARGDGIPGVSAVASVVMNRCRVAKSWIGKYGRNHPLFGDGSPASACLVPWQFSAWNKNDPNRPKIIAVTAEEDPNFETCLTIAAEAIAGKLQDPTEGSTYYKETTLPWPSAWGPEKSPNVTIGHQEFFAF